MTRLLPLDYETDPGCAAKVAVADALYQLSSGAPALWRTAIVARQMEPVWGKSIDTAANLRAIAALGLVATSFGLSAAHSNKLTTLAFHQLDRPALTPMNPDNSFAARYTRDGFLIVPNLVSADDIARLRRDSADLARGRYPSKSLKPLPETMSDDEVQRRILCIHMPHHLSPVITSFIKHQAVVDVLTQIIGPDVKCMQSMLFVKPPGFQGQAWHQDEIYIPTRDRSLCGAWIAMDDATQENGCLWVVPGSHVKGYLYPQRSHENPDEFDGAQESFGFEESGAVPAEVTAGSVVFFNGYLLHRSKKNRSQNDYRRALVSHYMNAYSLLPWDLKEGERVATADRRDIILVAGTDPYAWKGLEEPGMEIYLRLCKANENLSGE